MLRGLQFIKNLNFVEDCRDNKQRECVDGKLASEYQNINKQLDIYK